MNDQQSRDVGGEVPPAEPPAGRWLFYLLFRPTKLFRHFVIDELPLLTVLAFYLFGVASVTERLDARILRDDARGRSTFAALADSWASYWTAGLVGGVISAALLARIGGWWYRKRLEFSGAGDVNLALVRRVYVFASLVWAVPALLYRVWTSAAYSTPRAAGQGDDLGGLVLIVFLFWSLVTSYRGVTTAFVLRPGAARLWFLILPAGLYAVVLLAFLGLMAAGLDAAPEVSRPRRVTRPGFEVSYPRNWVIDERMANYDPDGYFSIEPELADCAVFVHVGRDFADVDEALDAYEDETGQTFGVAQWLPVEQWSALAGRGKRGLGKVTGHGDYTVILFATAHSDGRILVVREICEVSVADKMAPGMRLISSSFRWR